MPQSAYLLDPLTGVYSRAALNARLAEELERSVRYELPFSLLLLDIDHFKSINDAFGHRLGDNVLTEFAHLLADNIRSSDSLFRYGGDEFVILLPNTDKAQALTFAERLQEVVHSTPLRVDPPLTLLTSMGLAAFPGDHQTAEGLFEIADQRHYLAKRTGRARVVSETPETSGREKLEPPSRLIERDKAQVTFQSFLDALVEQNRSVLRVSGPPGSGRTRLLAEIRNAARLRGYATLAFTGRPTTKNRLYASLTDNISPWLPFSDRWLSEDNAGSLLHKILEEKGQSGIVITLDEPHNLDRATLEFLRALFFDVEIPQLGLAYTGDLTSALRSFPRNIPLQESVQLTPLSLAGVRIWLRQSMKWEAPQEFVVWLHEKTGGLPGNLGRLLAYLQTQGLLVFSPTGWSYPQDFSQIDRAVILAQQAESPPNNLPVLPGEFINRVNEITALKRSLEEARLVTLTGPDGSGKTATALQAASECLDLFADGAFIVDLSKINEQDEWFHALATTLQFPLEAHQPVKEQIEHFLRGRNVLLILDHFDAMYLERDYLSHIVSAAPRTHLLVTSRERLNLPDEHVIELPGMDIPADDTEQNPQAYSAINLFLHFARRIRLDFNLTPENIPWIIQICRMTGGLPLAIELAAAWVQIFSPEEIAARIGRNLDFPSSGGQAASDPARIHAVLDSFWELFSSTDQITLCQLAVFEGGFSREMAQKVASASPFFLDALTAKSFLVKTSGGQYRLHELQRQYLFARLQALPEEEIRTRDRHCRAYAAMVGQMEACLSGEGQRGAVRIMAADLENITAATNWAIQNEYRALLAQLIPGLSHFYSLQGSFHQAYRLLDYAMRQIEPARNKNIPEPEFDALLGMILVRKGRFASSLGRHQEAIMTIKRGIDLQMAVDEPAAAAQSHIWLAEVNRSVGDYEAAEDNTECALSLYRDSGNLTGESVALSSLGLTQNLQGRHIEARQNFTNALELARALEDRGQICRSLNNLGYLAYLRKDYAAARAHLIESLELAREIDVPIMLANVLESLGQVEMELKAYEQAARCFLEALKIGSQLNALPLILEIMVSIAFLWCRLENYQKALALVSVPLHHPVCPPSELVRAEKIRVECSAFLSDEAAIAAAQTYQNRMLHDILDELLSTPVNLHG